jgi:hypothetical protein
LNNINEESKSGAQEGEESIRALITRVFPQKIVSARIMFIALPEKYQGKIGTQGHTMKKRETRINRRLNGKEMKGKVNSCQAGTKG